MNRALLAAGLALVLTPSLVLAQAGLRDGDRLFDRAALAGELAGQAVEFHDGSTASYFDDGRYSYVYGPGQPPFSGRYDVTEDSAVCVTFDNGFARCDTYVHDGQRLVLIVAAGDRFPVRGRTALEN